MNASKKIKAALLLVVFSMHTLVGLACSVGFTLGGESHSGHAEAVGLMPQSSHDHETPSAHLHDEVVPANHHEADASDHPHDVPAVSNHHDEAADLHTEQDVTSKDCKDDDCCTDDVVKLSLIDKALTSINIDGISLPQQLEFLLSAFVVAIYSQSTSLTKVKPPNLRSWSQATHTDLRIVIQSFQI